MDPGLRRDLFWACRRPIVGPGFRRDADYGRADARRISLSLRVIVDLEQEAAAVRLEGAVHRAGRAAGIGVGREALAAFALGIVADRQIAVDEIHLFPILVDERLGREHARLEAQQPGA